MYSVHKYRVRTSFCQQFRDIYILQFIVDWISNLRSKIQYHALNVYNIAKLLTDHCYYTAVGKICRT